MTGSFPSPSPCLVPRLRRALQLQRWRIERVVAIEGDEAVHDLRVALRRTSALARLGRGVPRGNVSRALQRTARDLLRALSVRRSREVTAAMLAERFDGDPKRRTAARAVARRILGRPSPASGPAGAAFLRRLERLRALFDARDRELAWLCRPGGRSEATRKSEARLERRSARRLRRLVGAVVEAGIPRPPGLHAFRIAAKQLRYALEFLGQGHEGAPELLRTLRRFQDVSGEAHDRMELAAAVKRIAARSAPGTPVGALVSPLEADARSSARTALESAAALLEELRAFLPAEEPSPRTKGIPLTS
jgi:CHAD domain-containing protein